tara:strand:+ start:641 stop:856 length:216 start_codon:yes stop_codon:yes gene_type:complete
MVIVHTALIVSPASRVKEDAVYVANSVAKEDELPLATEKLFPSFHVVPVAVDADTRLVVVPLSLPSKYPSH